MDDAVRKLFNDISAMKEKVAASIDEAKNLELAIKGETVPGFEPIISTLPYINNSTIKSVLDFIHESTYFQVLDTQDSLVSLSIENAQNELIEKMKTQALLLDANAIVNFRMTTNVVPISYSTGGGSFIEVYNVHFMHGVTITADGMAVFVEEDVSSPTAVPNNLDQGIASGVCRGLNHDLGQS